MEWPSCQLLLFVPCCRSHKSFNNYIFSIKMQMLWHLYCCVINNEKYSSSIPPVLIVKIRFLIYLAIRAKIVRLYYQYKCLYIPVRYCNVSITDWFMNYYKRFIHIIYADNMCACWRKGWKKRSTVRWPSININQSTGKGGEVGLE